MLLTAVRVGAVHAAPGSFPGLMDLYEGSYIAFRRLVPSLPPVGERRVSKVPGALDLHLQVLERHRFTTDCHLTYRFDDGPGGGVAAPDLRLRIYHDARLAEVTMAHLRHWPVFDASPEAEMAPRLNARWYVNRFLVKWLRYCLHQGHAFTAVSARD